jgi:redox-sensitive bicupin YhaK (pirin superfamily)
MSTRISRDIKETWKVKYRSQSATHSSGVILPFGDMKRFDPFLIMAEDKFQSDAFDFHPHRGMETVTYVLDGELHHKDNKGGYGVLHAGDAQWMTAGSGIIHLEAPPEGTTVHTLQLWVNLPKAHKMAEPRYQDILRENVPMRRDEAVEYRVYSGSSNEVVSTTKNYVPVTMVEIQAYAGFYAAQDIPSDFNGFMYVLEGSGTFGNNKIKADKGEVLLLADVAGDSKMSEITMRADAFLRVLLYAGKPLNEPIAARGPFVMNTEEELTQAYADYKAGKFN